MSKTGGHLGSSLGVVELTVALHHVFDCPDDKILWDVGHQVWLTSFLRFWWNQADLRRFRVAEHADEQRFRIGLGRVREAVSCF